MDMRLDRLLLDLVPVTVAAPLAAAAPAASLPAPGGGTGERDRVDILTDRLSCGGRSRRIFTVVDR